jgi:hypothetical protein
MFMNIFNKYIHKIVLIVTWESFRSLWLIRQRDISYKDKQKMFSESILYRVVWIFKNFYTFDILIP